jgi:hypothetical protein
MLAPASVFDPAASGPVNSQIVKLDSRQLFKGQVSELNEYTCGWSNPGSTVEAESVSITQLSGPLSAQEGRSILETETPSPNWRPLAGLGDWALVNGPSTYFADGDLLVTFQGPGVNTAEVQDAAALLIGKDLP